MDEKEKKLNNVKIFCKHAGIDASKQEVFIRDELDYTQMLLLCQMSLYDIPDEFIRALAEQGAEPETIKNAFINYILTQHGREIKTIDTIQEMVNGIEKKRKQYAELQQKLSDQILDRFGSYTEQNQTFLNSVSESFNAFVKTQKDELESAKDSLCVQAGSYEPRKYNIRETIAFEHLKGKLATLSPRRLKYLVRALDAEVKPSQILKYIDVTNDEQLELILYILLKEKERGMNDGK